MRDLELCLGEDHHKISGWIANGWLQDHFQGTRRHGGNGNDIHRIRERAILDFIKSHPQEINLGKVDQTWFLDLVLLKGREVPEAKSPRRTESAEEALRLNPRRVRVLRLKSSHSPGSQALATKIKEGVSSHGTAQERTRF